MAEWDIEAKYRAAQNRVEKHSKPKHTKELWNRQPEPKHTKHRGAA